MGPIWQNSFHFSLIGQSGELAMLRGPWTMDQGPKPCALLSQSSTGILKIFHANRFQTNLHSSLQLKACCPAIRMAQKMWGAVFVCVCGRALCRDMETTHLKIGQVPWGRPSETTPSAQVKFLKACFGPQWQWGICFPNTNHGSMASLPVDQQVCVTNSFFL